LRHMRMVVTGLPKTLSQKSAIKVFGAHGWTRCRGGKHDCEPERLGVISRVDGELPGEAALEDVREGPTMRELVAKYRGEMPPVSECPACHRPLPRNGVGRAGRHHRPRRASLGGSRGGLPPLDSVSRAYWRRVPAQREEITGERRRWREERPSSDSGDSCAYCGRVARS
jgi:hypothetical protein